MPGHFASLCMQDVQDKMSVKDNIGWENASLVTWIYFELYNCWSTALAYLEWKYMSILKRTLHIIMQKLWVLIRQTIFNPLFLYENMLVLKHFEIDGLFFKFSLFTI